MLGGKSGVLIHGYHLDAPGWEHMVWGIPPESPGRLPKGIAVSLQEDAQVIVLGTGASQRDGKKEAEHTRDYLLEHFAELEQFSLFRGIDVRSSQSRIEKIIHTETQSQNTKQEIKLAADIFNAACVDRIVLVSSAAHLPRCLRDACSIFSEDQRFSSFAQHLSASPSQSFYNGFTAKDVAIIEPSHRPDGTSSNLHILASRMLTVPPQARQTFEKELANLLGKYDPRTI